MRDRLRIAINGFGRIGRTIARQVLLGDANGDIEIIAINDIAPLETCAYLFRYDSTFGPYPELVEAKDNAITLGGMTIPFHAASDLSELDLSTVDVLLECTGQAHSQKTIEIGLQAGARAVLIAGPSKAAETTIVLGGNQSSLGSERIISNSSCTTNAIVPLLKRLDAQCGVARAHATTIHCYTGSQPSVDAPGTSLSRSRAAAVSMIPTSTSAACQVAKILPKFDGRLSVSAVRVPCLSVSAVDLVFQLVDMPTAPLPDFLRTCFEPENRIGLTDEACVSADMRARSESVVVALPEAQLLGGGQLRVFGWYDNEWGFSARMIEMARLIASRDKQGDHHAT